MLYTKNVLTIILVKIKIKISNIKTACTLLFVNVSQVFIILMLRQRPCNSDATVQVLEPHDFEHREFNFLRDITLSFIYQYHNLSSHNLSFTSSSPYSKKQVLMSMLVTSVMSQQIQNPNYSPHR